MFSGESTWNSTRSAAQKSGTPWQDSQPDSLGGRRVESEDRRDGVKYHLAGGAWAAARLSGTEPLVRLYAEAPDDACLADVLSDLRALLAV